MHISSSADIVGAYYWLFLARGTPPLSLTFESMHVQFNADHCLGLWLESAASSMLVR
jgi:hypothetical protein